MCLTFQQPGGDGAAITELPDKVDGLVQHPEFLEGAEDVVIGMEPKALEMSSYVTVYCLLTLQVSSSATWCTELCS